MNAPKESLRPCSYRQPIAGHPDEETVYCDLLQQLTAVEDRSLCQIHLDACRACAGWLRPSRQHLNPVVGSLLYNLTSQIVDRSGVAGCSRELAAQLHKWAAESIPAEEDYISVAEETSRQANLDCPDIETLVPRPRQQAGPPVTRWCVGVTTAPREPATLDSCLASLVAAGWREPRLFVDGQVPLSAAAAELPTTQRDPQMGAWPSYYLALGELVMRTPHADAYMLVQDDVVLFQHPLLRPYLEAILWPGKRPGIVSLFCSRAYAQPRPGWYALDDALVWGGQALIFSHSAALRFLADPEVVRHRLAPGKKGLTNIDGRIGQWAQRVGIPIYVPTPSLAQHIGHVSSLWLTAQSYGNRRADWFAGHARKA